MRALALFISIIAIPCERSRCSRSPGFVTWPFGHVRLGVPLLISFRMIPITVAPFGREVVPVDADAPGSGAIAVPAHWTTRAAY